MNRFLLRSVGAIAIVASFLAALSCARDQQLEFIEVRPTTENFGGPDPSLNVQLQARGHYIHPVVVKDITGKVTWSSNTPGVAVVSSSGLLAPGGIDCGNALISANVQTNTSVGNRSSSGAVITGTMTANVSCTGGSGSSGSGGSGGGNSNLTVDFSGAGSGTISSTPSGLGCAFSPCSGGFQTGSSVTLTATPNIGSTFGGWLGCDSTSGQACNLVLNSDRVVTITFN